MALGGSESLEEWKSVDQLLSDLFQDPGVSSLINGTTDSSTNWRYSRPVFCVVSNSSGIDHNARVMGVIILLKPLCTYM